MSTVISFVECKSDGNTTSVNMRRKTDEDDIDLINRAVVKVYGKTHCLWVDNGLKRPKGAGFYGQIIKPCKTGGSTCETGRIRVDID